MFRISTDIGAAEECGAIIYPVRRDHETRSAQFGGRTVQLRCISPGEAFTVSSSDETQKTVCAVFPDRSGGDGDVCAAAIIAGLAGTAATSSAARVIARSLYSSLSSVCLSKIAFRSTGENT